MAEAGFPEVNTKLWSGFFAAAGTPPAVLAKLEANLRKAISDADVNQKLKGMAVNPGGGTSAGFRAMIDKDIEGYVAVIKAANLKFDKLKPFTHVELSWPGLSRPSTTFLSQSKTWMPGTRPGMTETNYPAEPKR